ncbi:MAG: fumarylacetoacetase [Gemmatimonadetes bacterium]|nr:fumarylacetoacetase [Gemmatimonadota bacterium]
MRNDTHHASLRSWVPGSDAGDFPIQNLPFGVFRVGDGTPRVAVAIGDSIVDVAAALDAGLFPNDAREAAAACDEPELNSLMALGPAPLSALRRALVELLRDDSELLAKNREACMSALVPMSSATMLMPAEVGDYTDFYASVHHATNVGSMFRPDNPLLPNYKWVPIGYHGRASSLVPSGSPVPRPMGQSKDDAAAAPTFGPTVRLDYELEVGIFVGAGNALGQAIGIERAEEHVFGLCLVNDWSARDVQAWEYQPLGPFLAKNFATSVSPWVVTMEALAPFRAPAFARAEGDPAPLPYLASERDQRSGGVDISLEVLLVTQQMRGRGDEPFRVSKGSFTSMYWTVAQLLTHHASNGCNMRPGDLLASGTVSGEAKESRGCLLERTWRGSEPLSLPNGESRRFLEDGDEVIIRGWCEREGAVRIGFGECRGIVTPARAGQ